MTNKIAEEIFNKLVKVRFVGDETYIKVKVEQGEDDSYYRIIVTDGRIDLTSLLKLVPLGLQTYNIIAVENELVVNVQFI